MPCEICMGCSYEFIYDSRSPDACARVYLSFVLLSFVILLEFYLLSIYTFKHLHIHDQK